MQMFLLIVFDDDLHDEKRRVKDAGAIHDRLCIMSHMSIVLQQAHKKHVKHLIYLTSS